MPNPPDDMFSLNPLMVTLFKIHQAKSHCFLNILFANNQSHPLDTCARDLWLIRCPRGGREGRAREGKRRRDPIFHSINLMHKILSLAATLREWPRRPRPPRTADGRDGDEGGRVILRLRREATESGRRQTTTNAQRCNTFFCLADSSRIVLSSKEESHHI